MQKQNFLLFCLCLVFIIAELSVNSSKINSSPQTKELIKQRCEEVKQLVKQLKTVLTAGYPKVLPVNVLKAVSVITDWLIEWNLIVIDITVNVDKEDGKFVF